MDNDSDMVHGHKLNDGEGRFLIKNLYVRAVVKWDNYRPNHHTNGTWIAWKLCDAKLHVEKERMKVAATSEAMDIAGPEEAEEGRGRKRK